MDHSTEVDNTYKTLALRMKYLAVSEGAMNQARILLKESGWIDDPAVEWLYNEWMNDHIAEEDEKYKSAAQNPDRHFLTWLDWRRNEPYHVTHRALDEVSKVYGSQMGLRMHLLRWNQEIAWAKRYRNHKEPIKCVMSALFLTESRKNPKKIFVALSDIYVENLCNGIDNERHPNNELTAEQIREGMGADDDWTPLFLQYGYKNFTTLLDRLTSDRIKALAKVASKEELDEIQQRAIKRGLAYLERHPLSCRVSALDLAVRRNMTANDLVACEESFIQKIKDGDIHVPDNETSLDQEFYHWIKIGDYKPDDPDEEEIERRAFAITLLNKSWIEDFPEDILILGATSRSLYGQWRASVLSGRRPPPKSCRVDYALFVFEHSLRKT